VRLWTRGGGGDEHSVEEEGGMSRREGGSRPRDGSVEPGRCISNLTKYRS
jgi:hypothetical protein